MFHNREYLVAVRSLDDALALHTMRFADEVVPADDLDIPKPSRAPAKREIEMAGALVDSLHDQFEPKAFKDTYRDQVLGLIASKAKGEEIDLPEELEPQQSADLMAALEASLKGSSRSGSRSKARSKSGSKSRSKSKARSTPKSKAKARS